MTSLIDHKINLDLLMAKIQRQSPNSLQVDACELRIQKRKDRERTLTDSWERFSRLFSFIKIYSNAESIC